MLSFPFSVLTAGILLVAVSPAIGEKSDALKKVDVQISADPEAAQTDATSGPQPSAKEAATPEQQAEKPKAEASVEKDLRATEEKVETVEMIDNPALAEKEEAVKAAVAIPVPAEPVQVFGWREEIRIEGVDEVFTAKLDSGALTSSVHAEEQELFERDGKKWVRFIVTDPTDNKPKRSRIEAPFVRMSRVKEPGGESTERMVVRLSFRIGERRMRSEFSLNNRSNMLAPVLIGRSAIKELGWVDAARVNLADDKIFR